MKAHQTLFVSKDRALVFGYWESYFSRWAPECDACFHDSLPNNSEHRNFDSRKGPRTPKVLLWKHLSFCLRSGTFHLAEITRSHNQSPRHEIVPGMISSAEIAFDSWKMDPGGENHRNSMEQHSRRVFFERFQLSASEITLNHQKSQSVQGLTSWFVIFESPCLFSFCNGSCLPKKKPILILREARHLYPLKKKMHNFAIEKWIGVAYL